MSHLKFAEIPVEILAHIFHHFSIPELVNCRLVSKKFKFAADQVRVRELAVVVDQYQSLHSIPFKYHAYEPVTEQNLLCLLNPRLFSSALQNEGILRRLAYFKLVGYVNWQQFDITALNALANLKQLDFDCAIVINGPVQLVLASLEILSFCQSISRRNMEGEDQLQIDAPKLRVLACQRLDKQLIQIVHPQSIEKLEINTFTWNLSSFVNLKSFQHNFGTTIRAEHLLSSLPEPLEELHIYLQDPLRYLYGLNMPTITNVHFSTIRSIISDLLQIRARLKRRMKIYLMGIEVIKSGRPEVNDFDEQFQSADSLFSVHKFLPPQQHYKQLADAPLPFYETIDYGDLSRLGYERIPDDFHRRFMNIQAIIVQHCVLNPADFVDFLRQTKNLTKLSISNSALKPQIFESLPSICPLLSELTLSDRMRRDVSFIFGFRMLIAFENQHPLSLLHAAEAFRSCKYLNHFFVENEMGKNSVTIKRVFNRCSKIPHHAYLIKHNNLNIKNGIIFELNELNKICKALYETG